MTITTLTEIKEKFRTYNRENNIIYGCTTNVPNITAVIVYKQSNFNKPYTELERSYRIDNCCGKAFFDTVSGSQSIRADCLDGKDLGVRIDYYHWEIDYCYFE